MLLQQQEEQQQQEQEEEEEEQQQQQQWTRIRFLWGPLCMHLKKELLLMICCGLLNALTSGKQVLLASGAP